jgi:trigger factor
MADTQTTAAPDAQQDEFSYPVKIEDVGPATKKVVIEIPQERISSKLQEQYRELRAQATIPGFRTGHAPQKLIERRFDKDVRDQVCQVLIRESYQQALEKNSLQVLGEPEFEQEDEIKLPESGPLTYSFQVEVQPEFLLPPTAGLKVRKPKVEITDANVDQAMTNLREQQGTLVPVEDRGVQSKDFVTADVHLKVEGEEVIHQHDAQLVARPGRIGGIQVDDLDKQLEGAKVGEKRSFTVKGPEQHANEKVRGKDVVVEIEVKDIKKLEPAEVNEEFLQSLGFENEQELRDALREQLVERVNADVQQAMRDQVNNYLLQNTNFELPAKLSARQADRVVQRRAVDLMMRGIPRDQIEANVEKLRSGAAEEAARELKLFFILQKVAEREGVDVDEAELNGRIAVIAAQQGKRPEKLKQEMAKDGSLMNLYVQMRERKAIDQILSTAVIEEFELNAEKGETAPTVAEAPAEGEKKE